MAETAPASTPATGTPPPPVALFRDNLSQSKATAPEARNIGDNITPIGSIPQKQAKAQAAKQPEAKALAQKGRDGKQPETVKPSKATRSKTIPSASGTTRRCGHWWRALRPGV